MAASITTSTRRGLALTFYAETLLLAGALAFILVPDRPAFLAWGVVLSALMGVFAAGFLWGGRRELGPDHARAVKRAAAAFAVTLLAILVAYSQLASVFPEPCSRGEACRIRDLWGPLTFFGFALVADAIAIEYSLWYLLDAKERRWLQATFGVTLVGLALYAWWGSTTIADFENRSGGVALNPAEAASYVNDFHLRITRMWAGVLAAMRLGYWPALFRAIGNVAQAEEEARSTTEWSVLEPQNP